MRAQPSVKAVGRWSSVQVDCADPIAEATFWADVLGSTVVEDLDGGSKRIEELGGRRAPGPDFEEYGFRWRLMTDPEGNEFCLILG
jgi:predicted enzyme related to lactoylglutathione lyase